MAILTIKVAINLLSNGHNSKDMLLENKKVAIIGGGPGGLTLILMLLKRP
ncbi:hypothetical protein SAMN05428949_5265 [Chitinophaga sp. YR627]|nr:hypothetical protein [Chitinophaga sp. YR627]SFO46585.1 hypothetical protein SAMN05428949_5265 [Chitinophaga sp. YR627]